MNRKHWIGGIIVLLLVIFNVQAVSIDLCTKLSITQFDSSTLYVGGNGPNNYTKIQDAIDSANDGDTVFVFDDLSPYYENILIDKEINLIGENRITTIIDGNDVDTTVKINSDKVSISKFTIQNCSYWNSGGIRGSTNYSTISNNYIICNNRSGIVLFYSNYNQILNNKIDSNRGSGIHLGTCNNNIVSENTISANFNSGFSQYESHNNTISGNYIARNENGINIGKYSKNNTISGNFVLFNEYGIRFDGADKDNLISRNSVRWNMYGISLHYSYMNKIEHNNFIRIFMNAFFESFYMDENATNYWSGNYWNRPRVLPKIIFGIQWTGYGWSRDPDLDIDRKPAKILNIIGEWDV